VSLYTYFSKTVRSLEKMRTSPIYRNLYTPAAISLLLLCNHLEQSCSHTSRPFQDCIIYSWSVAMLCGWENNCKYGFVVESTVSNATSLVHSKYAQQQWKSRFHEAHAQLMWSSRSLSGMEKMSSVTETLVSLVPVNFTGWCVVKLPGYNLTSQTVPFDTMYLHMLNSSNFHPLH